MAEDFEFEIAQIASLQAAVEAEEESLALALSASVAGYTGRDEVHLENEMRMALEESFNTEGVARAPTVDATPKLAHITFSADGWDGPVDCVICTADFEDGEALLQVPTCRHAFHPQCIQQWLEHQAVCPMCRTDLTLLPDVDDGSSTRRVAANDADASGGLTFVAAVAAPPQRAAALPPIAKAALAKAAQAKAAQAKAAAPAVALPKAARPKASPLLPRAALPKSAPKALPKPPAGPARPAREVPRASATARPGPDAGRLQASAAMPKRAAAPKLGMPKQAAKAPAAARALAVARGKAPGAAPRDALDVLEGQFDDLQAALRLSAEMHETEEADLQRALTLSLASP